MLLTFSIGLATMAFLGIGVDSNIIRTGDHNIPFELIKNSFSISSLHILSFGVSALIPVLFLGLFGVMMLRRQIIWNGRFGWSMAGLWFMSLITTSLGVASLIQQIREVGEYQDVTKYSIKNKTVLITTNQAQKNQYRLAQLQLVGYEGKDLKLEKNYIANGADEDDATLNAQMLNYEVKQKDSTLVFDRGASFKPNNSKYRKQRVSVILHIPYNQVFMMTQDVEKILHNTLYPHGYSASHIKDNQWTFTKKGLVCLTCKESPRNEDDEDFTQVEAEMQLEEFERVELSGTFEVDIKKGDKYQLKVLNEEARDNISLDQDGNTLEISLKNWHHKNRPRLEITTPNFESLSINGASEVNVDKFKIEDLHIEIAGASKVNLEGEAQSLHAEIMGAGQLNAYKLAVKEAHLEIAGAADVEVTVKESLFVEAAGACSVKYKGNPKSVKKDIAGLSSVKRVD
jgi:hypothetical protein